jgi:hypothetical protein
MCLQRKGSSETKEVHVVSAPFFGGKITSLRSNSSVRRASCGAFSSRAPSVSLHKPCAVAYGVVQTSVKKATTNKPGQESSRDSKGLKRRSSALLLKSASVQTTNWSGCKEALILKLLQEVCSVFP